MSDFDLNIDIAISSLNTFLNTMITAAQPNNNANRSWEHCYEAFGNMHAAYQKAAEEGNTKCKDAITDYLSLHLGFYLASWGMYRGSAPIRAFDYTIHCKAVEIVYDYYDTLRGQLPKDGNNASLVSLCSDLLNHYVQLFEPSFDCKKARGGLAIQLRKHPKGITETLITKIILGTLGCVPAYDTYLTNTMKKYSTAQKLQAGFPESLSVITEYWEKNEKELRKALNKKNTISSKCVDYPPMKIMDMILFQTGITNG